MALPLPLLLLYIDPMKKTCMIARSLVYSDGEKVSFSGNLIWCGKQTIINNVVGNFRHEYHSHPQDSLFEVL